MKIIIVGVGNVGIELVKQLSKEDHDLIVIDQDATLIENVVNSYDIKGILGNGVSYSVMSEAGIADCDLLIACTQYDEMNVLCCLVGKKLGAKDTIARVKNQEYSELFVGRELGISMLVNPDFEAATEISRILRFPSAIKIEPFAGGKVDIIELKVNSGTVFDGTALKDLSAKLKNKILICAVERDGEVTIPSGDFVLAADDKIYVTASSKDISELFNELDMHKGTRRVLMIGGSRIAFYLAKELEKTNIEVKIIEKNEQKCRYLSENLDKAEIILGDGTDRELLLDEGMADTNALIILGGIDEQNIIISMYAISKSVNKVITKIDNTSYFTLLENSGIDSIVSTKASTANQIIRYVRGKENSLGSSVNKLYRIVGDQAEVLEFNVTESFAGLNVPLAKLGLKKNMLIAGIIRGGKLITPSGGDAIEQNDLVLVVTLSAFLDDLNDILE